MFFSDAVFAIVITLLVLDIRPPDLGMGASEAQWERALAALVPHVAAFALSFLVVGALWVAHHTLMSLVQGFSSRLMWPNLYMLLLIALVPFASAALAGAGTRAPAPFVLYCGLLLGASLLKARLTSIALRPDLISPAADPARVRAERRRRWIMPLAAGLALALAFIVPAWNTLALALIPLLRRLPWFTPSALRASGATAAPASASDPA